MEEPKTEEPKPDDPRFRHHPPSHQTVADHHAHYRRRFAELAAEIERTLPSNRERSLAMTNLETASFWINAAIARGQVGINS